MGLWRIWKNRHRVLGLNARYLDYIRPYNLKRAIHIADDKVLTKKVLKKAGVPTPELLGVIRDMQELNGFDFDALPKSFVLKPVFGSEGRGIDIFYNRKGDEWIKASGERVHIDELKSRVREILEGRYSMFNQPDVALFEERVKPHKSFRYYTYKGTPDVRVIMFNGVPMMGMLRLPTEESDGKANLKLNGIGGAIDIAAGRVMTAVKGKAQEIEFVPHTKQRISGLRIPYWERILKYSAAAQAATGLGYGCFDFLIDREKGPLLVEIGARPGLSIQLADQEGLRSRLDRVKGIKIKSLDHGIRLGKNMFGGEIEESVENLTGKPVLGIIEDVEIFGPDEKKKTKLKAKIDTGADSTSINRETLEKLGYEEVLKQYDEFMSENYPDLDLNGMSQAEAKEIAQKITEEVMAAGMEIERVTEVFSSHGATLRPYIKIELMVKDLSFTTTASAYDRSRLKYPMIIGRKSLSKFLVDPSK